ncbi:MAG: hypothetical protein ACR2QO_10880 [Acidimicrobiales bacterium]
MTDVDLDALERPEIWAETFDVETVAALQLADAMCGDTHTLDPSLMAELRIHFTEAGLAELILVAGQANLNNRVGNAAKQLLGPAVPD